MRMLTVVGTLACLLVGAPHAAAAHSSVAQCGSQSIGPGSIERHDGGGARCFLAAYDNHCRSASYELGMFGIDTIATRHFTLEHSAGRCLVAVQTTFRVVPQQPHVTGRGTCRTLRAVGSAVVATGCRGQGLAPSMSLTAVG